MASKGKPSNVFSINANRFAEWTLTGTKQRNNPWEEITVTAVMSGSDGTVIRAPAFWDGESTWRVRMTASAPGTWKIISECSDPSDENAGGSPWESEYKRINPKYFEACDRRILHMVESGMVPCILGGWGFHSLFMGKERVISHWRYLAACYGALPVIWCIAGEGALPYYDSKDHEGDNKKLKTVWPDVARAVHSFGPWHRPVTLHPVNCSWEDTTDPSTLDFFMLQPGHGRDVSALPCRIY